MKRGWQEILYEHVLPLRGFSDVRRQTDDVRQGQRVFDKSSDEAVTSDETSIRWIWMYQVWSEKNEDDRSRLKVWYLWNKCPQPKSYFGSRFSTHKCLLIGDFNPESIFSCLSFYFMRITLMELLRLISSNLWLNFEDVDRSFEWIFTVSKVLEKMDFSNVRSVDS